MANILPQDYKKRITKEYRLRLLAVTGFLIFFTTLGAIALLIPSYVMSNAVGNTYEGQIAAAGLDANQSPDAALSTTLSEVQHFLAYLSTHTTPSSEETVRTIISLKPSGVYLTRLAIDHAGETAGINVSGIAATRADLLVFVERLQGAEEFSSVDLPVSNLARGSEIPFSITFTFASSTPAAAPQTSEPTT